MKKNTIIAIITVLIASLVFAGFFYWYTTPNSSNVLSPITIVQPPRIDEVSKLRDSGTDKPYDASRDSGTKAKYDPSRDGKTPETKY